MNAESVIQIIQALLTPVLMISACGLLVLTIQNRYGRLNDRLRGLTREKMKLLSEKTDSAKSHISTIEQQIPELLKRNKFLRNALVAIFSAVTLFILVIFFIALAILYDVPFTAHLSLAAFLFGLIAIFCSMSYVLAELYISHKAVTHETENLISMASSSLI